MLGRSKTPASTSGLCSWKPTVASIDDPFGILNSDPIPDVPQTALAFRTWRVSSSGLLLSINPPSLTGKAGGKTQPGPRRVGYMKLQQAFAADGGDGWPIGGPLLAACGRMGQNAEEQASHGKIPSKPCSCGIYATTSLKVINQYLGNEEVDGQALRGPVLGIVEMGGAVIPATQGFRARFARVAAIIALDEVISLTYPQLKQIASKYKVPLLRDRSADPEEYREEIEETMPAMTDDDTGVGDEVEEFLMGLSAPDEEDKGDKGDEE